MIIRLSALLTEDDGEPFFVYYMTTIVSNRPGQATLNVLNQPKALAVQTNDFLNIRSFRLCRLGLSL